MNKRILLSSVLAMAAIIFSFSSCEVGDDGGNEQGKMLTRALAIHNYTHFQSKVALDAADIAFP